MILKTIYIQRNYLKYEKICFVISNLSAGGAKKSILRLSGKLSEEKQKTYANYIVHLGRYVPQKRHNILLKAYKASGTKEKLLLLGKFYKGRIIMSYCVSLYAVPAPGQKIKGETSYLGTVRTHMHKAPPYCYSSRS